MGVDLPTGSGWRTGGPSVTEADQNLELVISKVVARRGRTFSAGSSRTPPQALVAYSDNGEVVDLTNAGEQSKGQVRWEVPEGEVDDLHRRPALVARQREAARARRRRPEHQSALAAVRSKTFSPILATSSATCPPTASGLSSTTRTNTKATGATTSSPSSRSAAATGCRITCPRSTATATRTTVARVKHDYRETVSDLVLAKHDRAVDRLVARARHALAQPVARLARQLARSVRGLRHPGDRELRPARGRRHESSGVQVCIVRRQRHRQAARLQRIGHLARRTLQRNARPGEGDRRPLCCSAA